MKKSPLETVKARFTDKASLVAAVKKLATEDLWLENLNEDKGLELVSNQKLLHLHEVLTAVKAEHGSREKLIDALVKAEKREKDADYKARYASWSTPRLYDRYRAAAKSAS
jgi:hypothetical protein